MSAHRTTYDGVVVVGTQPQCGKTLVTGALAVILSRIGFGVQAYKPISFKFVPDEFDVIVQDVDQDYFNRVTHQAMGYTTAVYNSPSAISTHQWNQLMHQMRTGPYPYLIEGPGSLTTPWLYKRPNVMVDAISVANDSGFPVLLVSNMSPNFIEQSHMAMSHLKHRGAKCLGMVVVHTYEHGQYQDEMLQLELVQLLCQSYDVPFLGRVPFDPEISTAALQPGPSVDLVEAHLDLLPFQMQSGLVLSCS